MNIKTGSAETFEWKNSCEIMEFYRHSLNLSQAKLALLLGVTQAIVGCWERGIKQPTISNFVKLAKVFGVSETEFLHPSEEVKNKISQMKLKKEEA